MTAKIFSGQGRANKMMTLFERHVIPGVPQGLAKHETIDTGRRQFDIRILESVQGCQAFFMMSHTGSCNDDIEEACLAARALVESGAAEVIIVAPHLPYGRRDHVDTMRSSNGARHVLRQFYDAGARRVITCELRTEQIQGFFDGALTHCRTTGLFADHLKSHARYHDATLVGPELGKSKYAARLRNRHQLPVAVIDSSADGSRSLLVAAQPKKYRKRALIIDHEITTGRTAAETARFLKAEGFSHIELFTHHAVLLPGALEAILSAGIKQLVTTDTIPHTSLPDWVTVLPAMSLVVRTIGRIVRGESASELWP